MNHIFRKNKAFCFTCSIRIFVLNFSIVAFAKFYKFLRFPEFLQNIFFILLVLLCFRSSESKRKFSWMLKMSVIKDGIPLKFCCCTTSTIILYTCGSMSIRISLPIMYKGHIVGSKAFSRSSATPEILKLTTCDVSFG